MTADAPKHSQHSTLKHMANNTASREGLKNLPLHLKLLLDKLLGDMAQDVIHYADDFMVATDGNLEDHLKKVGQVLGRLKKGNIKIRPQKISVAKPTVDFLSVVWQKGKLLIPEERLLAFTELPSPNMPKKTKGIVAMIRYCQKFIPHYAHPAKPLGDLAMAHPKQFKGTHKHETCYQILIEHIKKHAMLHLPDPTKPYYMQTDAPDRVFQKDEEGDEKTLAWVSRMFTKTEHTYNTVKKEVLVLLYTLKTMDFFLRFAAKIIILVDSQAIQILQMCCQSTGILLRFSMELSLYDCKIHHFKGENNEISVIHSRYHPDIDQLKEDMKAEETTGVYKSRWLEKNKQADENFKHLCFNILFVSLCVD